MKNVMAVCRFEIILWVFLLLEFMCSGCPHPFYTRMYVYIRSHMERWWERWLFPLLQSFKNMKMFLPSPDWYRIIMLTSFFFFKASVIFWELSFPSFFWAKCKHCHIWPIDPKALAWTTDWNLNEGQLSVWWPAAYEMIWCEISSRSCAHTR